MISTTWMVHKHGPKILACRRIFKSSFILDSEARLFKLFLDTHEHIGLYYIHHTLLGVYNLLDGSYVCCGVVYAKYFETNKSCNGDYTIDKPPRLAYLWLRFLKPLSRLTTNKLKGSCVNLASQRQCLRSTLLVLGSAISLVSKKIDRWWKPTPNLQQRSQK